jgi:hypothetical protein
MPESILQALKQLLLAGLALVTSLSGAAGANAGHAQAPKAEKRQVTVVPRLPADEVLTVDEGQDAEQTGDVEEKETEEVDPEDLNEPVSIQYITLRGPITSRPQGGVIGTWTIAGRQVEVTAETHVSTRAARAKVGDWAQVQAEERGAAEPQPSALVARSLAVMSSDNLARIVGTIESLEAAGQTSDAVWVVSGVTVRVTKDTRIVGTPEVGRLADVHGTMKPVEATPSTAAPGGSEAEVEEQPALEFVAKEIIVRGTPNQPKPKEHKKFDLSGVVESIDAETGEWVVAGQTVRVTKETVFDEKKGKAEVGAMVRVQAEEDDEGTLTATRIQVVRSAQPGKGKGAPRATATAEPGESEEESVQPEATRVGRPAQGRGQGGKD